MKELDLSIFPKIDKSQWMQLAQNQLKGANPNEKLNWDSHGITNIESYFDATDIDSLSYLKEFFTTIPSHRWKLYQLVKVEDEKNANTEALNALLGGCDGIIFYVENEDVSSLLNGVDLSICDISFFSDHQEITVLPEELKMIKGPNESNVVDKSENYDSPITQVVEILKSISVEKFILRNSFPDFFLEIATIRALRYLLEAEKDLDNIHIHSSISMHESAEHQWFLNTTAGLASILGGSHSISMPTQIGDERITRNVGNLIRDESQINEYTDQCGGSYYVDSLTDRIIREVKETLGI